MSNSNTYYNASGDHQNTALTTPSYQSSGNYYQQASHNYAYPSYNTSYQPQYIQPYYYNQTAGSPSVGTDATSSVPSGAGHGGSYMGHGGAAGGYSSHPTNQPPPPGTTSWRPDAATPALPPVQVFVMANFDFDILNSFFFVIYFA